MVDNITLKIKKININDDIDKEINEIISKVDKITLSTLNEIDDVIKYFWHRYFFTKFLPKQIMIKRY